MKDIAKKYAGIIKRHRAWFLLPVIVVPMIALVTVFSREQLYQASSEVIFFPGTKEAAHTGSLYIEGRDVPLESAIAIMGSDSVKEKIHAAYRARMQAKRKAKSTQIEIAPSMPIYVPDKKFNTVTVTVADRDAAMAEFMSNFAANLMVSEYVRLNDSNFESASEAIRHRMTEVQKKQESLEEAIRAHKAESRIPDSVDQKSGLQSHLERLQMYQFERQGSIEELRAKINAILEELNIGSADEAVFWGQLTRNQEIEALQSSVIEAKVTLEELKSRYGPSHPQLQQGQYLVQELENKLKQQINQYLLQKSGKAFAKKLSDSDKVSLTVSQLRMIDELMATETELKAKETHLEQIKRSIDSIQKELVSPSEEGYTLERLQREYNATVKSLAFLQEQQESLDLTRNNTLQKAQISKKARVATPKSLVGKLLFAFACAPIIGALLAIGWEMLDKRIYTRYDLEQLIQLPVIQEIPFDKTIMLLSGSARKDFVDVFDDPGEQAKQKVALVPEIAGVSIKQELFQLKSRLSSLLAKGQKVFTILSPETGSGTTFLITNLALLFAESGMKTLVIDGNLRNPEIHEIFHVGNEAGITDFLQGEANIKQVLQHIHRYGPLFVMPAGVAEQDPLYYLEHPKIEELIQGLKKHFDVLFLNVPSDMQLMDVPVVANLSQKIILNIRQEDATLPRLRAWQKQLELVNREKLGVVVNFKTL